MFRCCNLNAIGNYGLVSLFGDSRLQGFRKSVREFDLEPQRAVGWMLDVPSAMPQPQARRRSKSGNTCRQGPGGIHDSALLLMFSFVVQAVEVEVTVNGGASRSAGME